MQKEIWKDVVGYEGLYQVSSLGRVKSFKSGKVKILTPVKTVYGYHQYSLIRFKSVKIFKAHRIVAFAFIENPYKMPIINHINGIKTDNEVSNLEWCTHSENLKHSYQCLNRVHHYKGVFGHNHNRSKKVYQYKDDILITEYGSAKEAERETGINSKGISLCANKKIKTSGGFFWSFNAIQH